MADFVNAGSVTRLQDAIAELNKTLPSDVAELRGLSEFGSAAVRESADNLDSLGRSIEAADELSSRLDAMRDDLGFIFSDHARTRLERVPQFMSAVLNVVIDVNTLTTGLEWLIPRLPHVRENLELIAPPLIREPSASPHQLNGNAATVTSFTKNKLVPFLLGAQRQREAGQHGRAGCERERLPAVEDGGGRSDESNPRMALGGRLIMTTVLGVGYLLIGGVLAVDPIEKRTSITVDLTDSSGLKSGSDVVYRGVNIGTVDEVTGRTGGGVRVALTYAADQRVPVATDLKIEQLSSLGEPVFAFMPNTDSGPWLEDGAHLTQTVEVPTSVAQLLGDTSAMLEQVEPERVTSLLDTLSQSVTGVESAVTPPAVRRGADLLLMTLPSRQGASRCADRSHDRDPLQDRRTEAGDDAAPPQLDAFGESLGVSYEYLFFASRKLRGSEVMGVLARRAEAAGRGAGETVARPPRARWHPSPPHLQGDRTAGRHDRPRRPSRPRHSFPSRRPAACHPDRAGIMIYNPPKQYKEYR